MAAPTLFYTLDGLASLEVSLSATDDGQQVKAAIGRELAVSPHHSDCHGHYNLSARRVNISGSTVLDWRVEFYCQTSPVAPTCHDDLTHIKGRLRWDGRAAERRAEDDRLTGRNGEWHDPSECDDPGCDQECWHTIPEDEPAVRTKYGVLC